MSKRILLMTSAEPDQSPFSTTEKKPPLGMGYIISVLRNRGHRVDFVDNYLRPYETFLESDEFIKRQYEYVGIYTNTICLRSALKMLYQLNYLRHTKKWEGKIIVGGPHTTVSPESLPSFVDYVVQGEGEDAVLDIVEGRVCSKFVRYPRIRDLDRLPMPAWDVFAALPYDWSCPFLNVQPVFTMNTSRGCPFRCAFCSVGSIWGRKYTYFSANRVVAEMEYLIRQYGARGFYFREDNFTVHRQRTVEICELLIRKNLNVAWACETRVDSLDRELVKLMAKAGAKGFYFGVESGSQRILDMLRKDITVEQIRRAFALCHEFDIRTAASVIVGIPGETEADLQKTKTLLKEIKPSIIWENVFVGIPNSFMYKSCIENKTYEYVDDRGLVYLKGHDERVKKYYGPFSKATIPVTIREGRINNPHVSVIMSVYNGGRYLKKAIESILRQSFQNFEFIIIDDGSTDETWSILSSVDDPRVIVKRNSMNMGLAATLNKAARMSRANYLARMDADDISLPHRLEKQMAFLEAHPEVVVVGSSFYKIDENGKVLEIVKVPCRSKEIYEVLWSRNCLAHGTVVMRKDVFFRYGGYDESYSCAQDYELWLRLAQSEKLANIEEPLYCWRSSPSCVSNLRATEQKMYARKALSKACRMLKKNYKYAPIIGGPLVSVIIPTFNRPQRVQESIQSVLRQSLRNFEIIIVNDGGEPIEKIIKEVAPESVYVRHDRNRGLAAARNTGLRLARGKYVAYLDDDDRFLPHHLKTTISFLENTNSHVVYTDAYRVYEDMSNGVYAEIKRDVPYSYDFDKDRILVENFIPVLCVVHRRTCLDDVGFFDENLPVLEDWDLWIRMSRKYRFHHLRRITVEFTWRNDGSSMTSSRRIDFIKYNSVIYKKYERYSSTKPHVLENQLNRLRSFREFIEKLEAAEAPSCVRPSPALGRCRKEVPFR